MGWHFATVPVVFRHLSEWHFATGLVAFYHFGKWHFTTGLVAFYHFDKWHFTTGLVVFRHRLTDLSSFRTWYYRQVPGFYILQQLLM